MPVPDIDIARLCNAMNRARRVLRRPREERVYMVKSALGNHWSEEGPSQKLYCNLIGMYQDIISSKLVSNSPRAMLSTDVPSAKPIVAAMERWANPEIEKINLANTLQRVVVDALYSIGICKVALATPADVSMTSWQMNAGQPGCWRIDLDDFVFDVHARDFDECSFMGHRYRVPLEVIRTSKIYSKQRKDVAASDDRLYNLEGDERIGVLGRTTLAGSGDTQEFEDMVDLWEVYLPRHRLIVTLMDDQLSGPGESSADRRHGKALRIQPWLGPASGPYHLLGFGVVPGNAMPKAPIQDLVDLHDAINRQLRKLIRQADRCKENLLVRNDETGQNVIQANDGEAVKSSDPSAVARVEWGMPNQALFQLFGAMRELFSWEAGNLEIAGGLGPQSKTLGQDEMLQAAASTTITHKQEKVVLLTTSVLKSLCWYWYHDPFKIMKSTHSLPGLPEMAIEQAIHPAGMVGSMQRNLPWDMINVRCDPYSLTQQTPQQRLAALNQLVGQIITPLMPLLQQQGISIDMHAYLSKVAKYMDSPDVTEIVTFIEPPQQDEAASSDQPSMPGSTTRNYNRRSSATGATTAGKDLETANAMRSSSNGQPQMAGA